MVKIGYLKIRNKRDEHVFYPLVIALAIIAVIVVITVVRKNKKEETQEEGSEE